jgi:uroporphyrinogen-III decarboxylase
MSIPYDVTFHPKWWHKNGGISFNAGFFYDDPHYRVEADLKMRRVLFEKFGDFGIGEENPAPRPILGSDLLATGYLYSAILGCQIRYTDDNAPQALCKNMTDEEIEALEVPDLNKSAVWQGLARQIDELQNEYGYVVPCVNLMGIQNIALDVRGQEFFIDCLTEPELANKILKVATELSIEIGRRFKKLSREISAGVTGIVKKTVPDIYLTSNCTVEMVSLANYKTFLLPYDQMLAKEFIPFGIHHCGATMEHVVDGYRLVDNLAFAEVGAFSDLAYVRKTLPNVYLNARYSPVKIKEASLEEMRGDIEKIYQDGKPAKYLSISCVGIDDGVSDDQVRNFLSCCRELSEKVGNN